MVQPVSAMESLVSSVQARLEDFLADQYSSEKHPYIGKVVTALALLGIYCSARNVYRHSKSLAKYCVVARQPMPTQSI